VSLQRLDWADAAGERQQDDVEPGEEEGYKPGHEDEHEPDDCTEKPGSTSTLAFTHCQPVRDVFSV